MFSAFTQPPTREQMLALAGIFQACRQVDNYARLGSGNSGDFETAIYSLLQQNPESTEAIYRDLGHLESGLEIMVRVLGNPKDQNNAVVLRYVLGVLYIGRKISADRKMLSRIAAGIEKAASQADVFGVTHTNVLTNLADLYQQTISTLNFRIQVHGVATHLQQPTTAGRIRCLLFSAVRSAFLWQQLRGSRVHLMFRRELLLKMARELHDSAKRQNSP